MSIRLKAFSIIGITVLILVLALFYAAHIVLVNSFMEQENHATEKGMENMAKMLEQQLSYLETTCGDWAQFDDTYGFIENGNNEYIAANLEAATLANLKLNVMLFLDSKGKMVWGKAFDLNSESFSQVPEDLAAQLTPGDKLLLHKSTDSVATGFISLKDGILMLSSRPVTSTDAKAPSNGVLIIGKYIDEELVTNLGDLTESSTALVDLSEAAEEKGLLEALDTASAGKAVYVKVESGDIISGYMLLKDIYDKPAAVLKAEFERTVFKQGQRAILFLLVALLISGILVFTVSFLLLQKVVISRLEGLNEFIRQTSASKNISGRVAVSGSDEISSLAEVTNDMLGEIDKIHNELRESEERLKFVMEGTNDGFWDWNHSSGDLYLSSKCLQMIGYQQGEIVITQEVWRSMLHEDDVDKALEALDRSLKGISPFLYLECRISTREGKWKWLLIRGKVGERDEKGIPMRMSGTVTDIDERKKAEEEIKYLSFHDKLTGLYNRAYFERELDSIALMNEIHFTIVLGDLNGLKLTNDVFGHEDGDKLVCKVAEILKNSCRSNDIIARWGGDEFAIILRGADEKTAAKICERIRRACLKVSDCAVKPSIALGAATRNSRLEDAKRLIKDAEEKMYRSKLLESRSARNSIISSLEQTLSERSHETEEHTKRIRDMCVRIGRELKMKADDLDQLTLLATLHDIGKIAIPDSILLKPAKLNKDEWDVMQRHTEIGYRIAQATPELMHVADAILAHHERYDGTGYPQGLKGNDIPLISRILSIADAYDVMTNVRPYKEAMSSQTAIEEIVRCSGSQFDPKLVNIFIKIIN